VQGSAEAIVQAMEKIGNDEVRVRVLHSGVGAITETDVGLAEASGAPVMGFNVRANASARNTANQKGVEIRYYSVIYDLVDDVKAAASGLLSAEIIARRSAGVRLLRDNVVIHEGRNRKGSRLGLLPFHLQVRLVLTNYRRPSKNGVVDFNGDTAIWHCFHENPLNGDAAS